MALTQARNEWTRNDFFEKNLGPEETANKYKADVGYPCEVSSFALEQPDLLPAYVDMTLQNIKYKNMSQKASNEKLMRNMYDHTMVAQLNKNPTFSKPDDGEKQNRSATVSLELKNPEFILSKKNDLEAEKALENPNSIAKPWMTDPGTGRFDYDAPEADNVKMVIDANASYVDRRDRFFVPPQQGLDAQKTRVLLETQEQEYQAALASVPRKGASGGKPFRR